MNFLAHAYLSFNNPSLIVGNLIADMVKGRKIEQLPQDIQEGIHLHRQIDDFTDKHPTVKETKLLFYSSAGRYGGSFLDIAFDHFLAKSDKFVPPLGWETFAEICYSAIEQKSEILPTPFISMFMYMKNENWLINYKYKWLIERSFQRLKNRAAYLSDDAPVYEEFEKHYDEIDMAFNSFFPDLITFVKMNQSN